MENGRFGEGCVGVEGVDAVTIGLCAFRAAGLWKNFHENSIGVERVGIFFEQGGGNFEGFGGLSGEEVGFRKEGLHIGSIGFFREDAADFADGLGI